MVYLKNGLLVMLVTSEHSNTAANTSAVTNIPPPINAPNPIPTEPCAIAANEENRSYVVSIINRIAQKRIEGKNRGEDRKDTWTSVSKS